MSTETRIHRPDSFSSEQLSAAQFKLNNLIAEHHEHRLGYTAQVLGRICDVANHPLATEYLLTDLIRQKLGRYRLAVEAGFVEDRDIIEELKGDIPRLLEEADALRILKEAVMPGVP